MKLFDNPHKRYNPLLDEWVLVSPHRTKRPWQGLVESLPHVKRPEYDPKCYLCPRNTRASGITNPDYKSTFVFTNDFSALLSDVPSGQFKEKDILQAHSETGICRVICFSPRHDLTLALMKTEEIRPVIDVWIDQYNELADNRDIRYVQIFENHGQMMGCSNPHPHCQVWANQTVPELPGRETRNQEAYMDKHGSCLLCDCLKVELKSRERVVFETDEFVVLVPFWAVWPFEVMVVSKKHYAAINELDEKAKLDLADVLRRLGIRFDNIFKSDFPYSMGFHQKPTDGGKHEEWHLHLHYYPPLLRSATVRKHMVGYELLAMPQRDMTAEQSAERLRDCPETHYTV
ncbi:MAG: UDP-glucose--hexose-1-phosphate uridylyltransferase [Spirochaetales bacterium]|nr:UDP-glucose--hexose-1-phosphate uridylyltransferase [Spirochaetales bacterium]